jgi:hypothetical protein
MRTRLTLLAATSTTLLVLCLPTLAEAARLAR